MKVKKEIRQQIKEQRRYACDQCGIADKSWKFCFQRKLNSKKHPLLANEPNNIRMLCQGCNQQREEERAANRRPSAKVNSNFRKRVRAERGDRCEVCGKTALEEAQNGRILHLHHKNKQRMHPEIRCDRANIILCCESCHVQLEAELNAALRERGAVESHSVDHSEHAGATYNLLTADLKSAARVEPRGEKTLSPGFPSPAKVEGAQRPRFDDIKKFVYGDEVLDLGNGLEKPAKTAEASKSQNRQKSTSQEPPGRIAKESDTLTPVRTSTNASYPPPNLKSLNLKLRQRANMLGLIPGSGPWRAYVLGTIAANIKRKRVN